MIDEHRPLDPHVTPLAIFALASEIGKSLREDSAYAHGKNARALVRSSDLTVVLVALQKDEILKPHHAAGPATTIVLEGEVLFRALTEQPSEQVLRQHDCAVFSATVEHSVVATAESLLLIVIGKKETSKPD